MSYILGQVSNKTVIGFNLPTGCKEAFFVGPVEKMCQERRCSRQLCLFVQCTYNYSKAFNLSSCIVVRMGFLLNLREDAKSSIKIINN